jgi:hypothetical protein
MVGH